MENEKSEFIDGVLKLAIKYKLDPLDLYRHLMAIIQVLYVKALMEAYKAKEEKDATD